jgi:hypothetical protein
MGQPAVSARARAAARLVDELRLEAKAVRAEATPRTDELGAIVAELFDLDALFVDWDGINPPPAELAARISVIERRLETVENRVSRLRRSLAA